MSKREADNAVPKFNRPVAIERAVGRTFNALATIGMVITGFDKEKSEIQLVRLDSPMPQGAKISEVLYLVLDKSDDGETFWTVEKKESDGEKDGGH